MGERMSKKLLLTVTCAAFALLAPLALAACGGDDDSGGSSADEDQITAAINAAATSGDPAACTKYQTVKFDSQTNDGSGQAAVRSCERDAQNGVADKVEVTDVSVDGDTATAKAAVTGSVFDGQTLDIGLVKEGGQWKLDEFKGFESFDKTAFIDAFPQQLQNDPGTTPQAVACIKTQLQQASDQQIEQAFLSTSDQAGDQIFGPCGKYFKGG
jgi:hypothetical protein